MTCAYAPPHVLCYAAIKPLPLCSPVDPRTCLPACLPACLQIGQLISDAMQRVGRAGVVTMEVRSGMVGLPRSS